MGTAVLALQGAFIEHEQKLEKLGEPFFEIREKADLKRPFDRLILPGGESTVQGRLLRKEGLLDPLRERIEDGMPVLATCAGLILLARNIEDDVEDGTDRSAARPQSHFGTLDATVQRNAYGRQLGEGAWQNAGCIRQRMQPLLQSARNISCTARLSSSSGWKARPSWAPCLTATMRPSTLARTSTSGPAFLM